MSAPISAPPMTAAPAEHRQRLFIPGPTDVAVRRCWPHRVAPMIGHRSDEFEALFAKCEAQLQHAVLPRPTRVYIVAASGTGLQEAAIRNAVGRRAASSALSTAPSANAGA
jgi:aspartate aminotransferase-like enzyme